MITTLIDSTVSKNRPATKSFSAAPVQMYDNDNQLTAKRKTSASCTLVGKKSRVDNTPRFAINVQIIFWKNYDDDSMTVFLVHISIPTIFISKYEITTEL